MVEMPLGREINLIFLLRNDLDGTLPGSREKNIKRGGKESTIFDGIRRGAMLGTVLY